jgi:uncharacterized protein (DUF4415 family)
MSKQKKAQRVNPRFRKIPRPQIFEERDIALSNAKINIHIRLDADLVAYFKEKAKREGSKYQSLINQHLRETVFEERNLEGRLQRIEERLGIN